MPWLWCMWPWMLWYLAGESVGRGGNVVTESGKNVAGGEMLSVGCRYGRRERAISVKGQSM